MSTLSALIPQEESEEEALALEEGTVARVQRTFPRWGKVAAASTAVLLLCACSPGHSSNAASSNGQRAVDLFSLHLAGLGDDEQLKPCFELMNKAAEAAGAAAGGSEGGSGRRRLSEEDDEEGDEAVDQAVDEGDEGNGIGDEKGVKDCLEALGLDSDNIDKAKKAGLDLAGFLLSLAKGEGGDREEDQNRNKVAFGALLGYALQHNEDKDYQKGVGELLDSNEW